MFLARKFVWKAGGQVFCSYWLAMIKIVAHLFPIICSICWQALMKPVVPKHLRIQQDGLPKSWALAMDLSITLIQQQWGYLNLSRQLISFSMKQDTLVWRPLGVATTWQWWDEPTQSLPLMDWRNVWVIWYMCFQSPVCFQSGPFWGSMTFFWRAVTFA